MTNPAPLTPEELAEIKAMATTFGDQTTLRLTATIEAAWAENERLHAYQETCADLAREVAEAETARLREALEDFVNFHVNRDDGVAVVKTRHIENARKALEGK
jgi:hypothetical protein